MHDRRRPALLHATEAVRYCAAAAATRPDPFVLCIDGRSGAGKSAFAARVAGLLADVTVVPVDHFVPGWHGLAAVVPALTAMAVDLAAGRPAIVRPWDWYAGRYGESEVIQPSRVVIVEGCAAGTRALAPHRDLLVWLELDEQRRYARAIARDGAEYQPWWDTWAAGEDSFYTSDPVAVNADLIVEMT